MDISKEKTKLLTTLANIINILEESNMLKNEEITLKFNSDNFYFIKKMFNSNEDMIEIKISNHRFLLALYE